MVDAVVRRSRAIARNDIKITSSIQIRRVACTKEKQDERMPEKITNALAHHGLALLTVEPGVLHNSLELVER